MDKISEMARAIRQEEIKRARQMSIPEKVIEGVRLFEQECEAARAEIFSVNPGWTDEQLDQEIERRLEPEREAKNTALALGLTP